MPEVNVAVVLATLVEKVGRLEKDKEHQEEEIGALRTELSEVKKEQATQKLEYTRVVSKGLGYLGAIGIAGTMIGWFLSHASITWGGSK
jgi:hypothetical protein